MKDETIRSIQTWGLDTFGASDTLAAFAKLVEEVGELSVAIRREGPDQMAEEIADVIVTAIHCGSGGRCIRDIQTALNAKMVINRNREWSLKGDGTGDHVVRASQDPPV